MIINRAALDGIETNFKAIAMQTFANSPRLDLTGIVLDVPMTGGKLDLSWVAVLGKMREWLGDRQVRDVVAKNFQIVPRHFEHTVGVDRDDIHDDNMGQYAAQIRLIAAGAVRFQDDIVATDGLGANSGAGPVCYDGQNLVDDSHPAFGPYAAFDNKNGTTTLTADATGYGLVLTGMGMMAAFADAEGRNLGLSADTLIVPSSKKSIAEVLVKSQYKVGTYADYNALQGLKLVVLPTLTTGSWYLVDSKSLVPPLVRALRQAPEFASDEANSFMSKMFNYGVDVRLEVAAGFPQAIVGAVCS